MAVTKRIIEHIRTPSGARFSIYTSDEDRRVQLIQYFNEVWSCSGTGIMPDDATLEEVIDSIEEFEDVDAEEIWSSEIEGLEPAERDTILAALRVYQAWLDGRTGTVDTQMIRDIATNNDTHTGMDALAIDDLCERLNV